MAMPAAPCPDLSGDLDPFGLLDTGIFRAPHETFHLLRHAEPIYWHAATRSWTLTRYKDVHALLNRPELLSSAARRPAARARLDPARRRALEPIDAYLSRWSLDLDPPTHTAIRQALNRWFTAAALRRVAPRVRALAQTLAHAYVAQGAGDLITRYAHPFPVRIIAEIVGVPEPDFPRLLDWFARLSLFFECGVARIETIHAAAAVIAEFDAWITDLLDWRRRHPVQDVISDLALSGMPGMDEAGLRSTLLLLLFSGHESSRATIGNAILALLHAPGEQRRLRADPALIGTAVEEFLRYDGPFLRQDRIAHAGFELEGRQIEAGDRVVLVLGAANRDPARFPDPDRLLLDRPDNQHVAFGHGIHFCLGSRLARMEIAAGVSALLDALPRLALGPGGYRWRDHFNNRGLTELDLMAG